MSKTTVIPYAPFAYQQAIHEFLDPRHGQARRIGAMIAGYGAGKTRFGAVEAIRQASAIGNTGHPFLCVGKTYPQARITSFRSVVDHLARAGLQQGRDFSSTWGGAGHEVRIPAWGGAWLVWGSAQIPDSLKGPNCCGAWLDEPGLYPEANQTGEKTWGLILARVREPTAGSLRVVLSGTPEGMNWLAKLLLAWGAPLRPGEAAHKKRRAWWQVPTWANKSLDAGYVPILLEAYGDRAARAFTEGEFLDIFEGQAYEAFRRSDHVRPLAYDAALPIMLAWDFNRNPMHVLAAQRHGAEVWVVREWKIKETTTWDAAQRVGLWLGEVQHARGVEVYGDPAGHSGSVRDRRSDFEQIRQAFAGQWGGYSDRTRRAHSAQTARVAAVNQWLRTGRVYVDPSCGALIDDLVQVRFKPGTAELDKHDLRLTHASDALGYMVEVLAIPPVYSIGG